MFDISATTVKWIKGSNAQIDNNVFKWHYRLTSIMLVIFFVLIGSRKYFGDPIDCTTADETRRVIDNYCWFNLYIIVPKDSDKKYEGDYHPHRPIIDNSIKSLEDLKNHSNYKARFLYAYQWIEFILFFQAVIFFLPRYLWRYVWEQGRVRSLCENFNRVSLRYIEDKEKYSNIAKYFKRTSNGNWEYAAKFIFCEILNFANVLTQFLVINGMLGGVDVNTLIEDFFYSGSNSYLEHPLNLVFPNMARCEIPVPRGGGSVLYQEYCVLPVNVFITKIYIFLWFYFLVLSVASGLALLYRFLTLISPKFRTTLLIRTGGLIRPDCDRAMRYLSYGDWFLLMSIGDNMDPVSFNYLIKEYNFQLENSNSSFTPHAPQATLLHSNSRPSMNGSLYNSEFVSSELDKMKDKEMEKIIDTKM